MLRHMNWIAVVAALILMLFCAAASAECSGTWGDLSWALDDEGLLTISGSGAMDGFAYDSTEGWKANNAAIKKVIIVEGVTSIGYNAFYGCTNLTDITVPGSVTSIRFYAFYDCSNLKSITIPDSVTSIEQAAFYSCNSLENITIPDGITSIENHTFSNCSGLMSIEIPDSVTKIGYEAFDGCKKLSNISIPNGITSIGFHAFQDCSQLTSITLPNGITAIENGLFFNCSSLTSITIPDGVSSIGSYAFFGCGSLTSIAIPDSVTFVGENVFYGCNAIRYANPNTYGAKALSRAGYSFRVPGKNYDLRYNLSTSDDITGTQLSFVDRDITEFIVPDGITDIGNLAFCRCSSLTSVTIPDGVTSIGEEAFSSCSSLMSIALPDGLTSIGRYAFYRCGNLTNITLPNSVTSIGVHAFRDCRSLTSIAIPDSITSIGEATFSDCSSLTDITIPDSVISIEGSAFSGCRGLMSIMLPDGLNSIGLSAFYGCRSLTGITIPATVTTINSFAFEECNRSLKLCISGRETTFGSNIISGNKATIYCYEYSDADLWATEQGYPVVYLDGVGVDQIREVILPDDFSLEQGKSRQINASVFPDYDRPEVVWSSSAPDIAQVDGGKVTAWAPGMATITASVGSVSASVTVNVFVEADDYALSPAEGWVVAKETIQLEAVNTLPDGAEATLTWISGDEEMATVDAGGLVTTKRPGDVTIAAVSAKGIRRESLLHICYPVTAIALDPASLTIKAGNTASLTANVTTRDDNRYVNRLVTFASSDEAVAVVDENGAVTGVGEGTAKITATAASGVTAACEVTVNGLCVFTLPAGLTAIRSEAFAGLPLADAVRIPAGVTDIAEDAFAGSDIAIYAPEGSSAAEWGRAHGFEVVEE